MPRTPRDGPRREDDTGAHTAIRGDDSREAIDECREDPSRGRRRRTGAGAGSMGSQEEGAEVNEDGTGNRGAQRHQSRSRETGKDSVRSSDEDFFETKEPQRRIEDERCGARFNGVPRPACENREREQDRQQTQYQRELDQRQETSRDTAGLEQSGDAAKRR